MVMGEFTQETDLLVIGAGPGGYAAAFRAADLGLDVTMVEISPEPGGVCLFTGCIPSKTLLYVTELIHDARRSTEMGITFSEPKIDLDRLRAWKTKVVARLAKGLSGLTQRRGILYLQGKATLEDSSHARVQNGSSSHIRFKHAIIATGSRPRPLPGEGFKPRGRIMDSTGALELADIPNRLLVVGGGFVGLELGSVYASLGSRVVLVEGNGQLMRGIDSDLSRPLLHRLQDLFESIHYNTVIESAQEDDSGVNVRLRGEIESNEKRFDRVLVATGRLPNSEGIGLENTGVKTNDHGFITIDGQRRTTDGKIFAIGDVTGGAMLAHKAMHEGKVAAEVISGMASSFDFQAVPAVLYTDPQIAVCGLSEEAAKRRAIKVKTTRFPWSASGRAVSMGLSSGMTKMIIDPDSQRILGVGIVGKDAGEMISEGVLAVEMGALAEDVSLSIHPHPTLSEAEEEAAGAFLGSSTHILPQNK
ncbi:MAG: dihydrolipoyl dehydrogenase [Syntrophobacteraceae bacterium]|nr:dihydrolipoyl dehydrogenase [Syntrophobacteraceae bacterium]